MGRFPILVSLVVAITGIFVAQTKRIMGNSDGPCVNDPEVWFDDGTSVHPCDVFSETYEQARDTFRAAARNASATLHTLKIVENYTIDIAIVKGNLPGLVIHSSGVHGVEGYAGSAIQVSWLKEILPQSKHYPTVLFVHAVNPKGMAGYRRWNENNIDLNRNALSENEWAKARSRDPNIASYVDFDELLNPRRAPTAWDDFVGFWVRAAIPLASYGITALKRSMVTGQYHNPKGIFYGGKELESSLVNLLQFMEENLHKVVNVTPADSVTWIDVHTGLGPSGQDTLLADDIWSPKQLAERFAGSIIPGLDHAGDGVKSGYDLSMGMLETLAVKLFVTTGKNPMLFLTQEFGTRPSVIVGKALVLENMAHHYLMNETEAYEWARSQTRPAFYVRTARWRRSVIQHGIRVLKQSFRRST